MSKDTNIPVNDPAAADDQDAPQAAAAPSDAVMADLEAKMSEYLTGWQRERADFANYKRRAEKDQYDAKTRGAQDAALKFIPLIDDFERAMANIPPELQANPWFGGITLMLNKFDKALVELHIEKIDPVGQPFDPNKHEAIGIDPEADSKGIASGNVSETLQKGYVSGERVLRSALVRVAP